MEEFEYKGYWWLPGQRHKNGLVDTVAGILRFSTENGASLVL